MSKKYLIVNPGGGAQGNALVIQTKGTNGNADTLAWAAVQGTSGQMATLTIKTSNENGGTTSYDGTAATLVDLTAFAKTTDLIENEKIKSSLLPSYVDDVIEGYYYEGSFYTDDGHTQSNLIAPETGKIYIDLTSGQENQSYRYGGNSTYVKISSVDVTSRLPKPTVASGTTDNGKVVTVAVDDGTITGTGVATLGFQVMKDTSTDGHVGEYYIEDPNA